MNKDKQRLLQKLYEALDMCNEQDLHHEHSLISMAVGCIEDEHMVTPEQEEKIKLENNLDDEGEYIESKQ
tara:strand:- start:295 stop:504 length:210 start_codon:yes stop_codon:yes gene_type:complete